MYLNVWIHHGAYRKEKKERQITVLGKDPKETKQTTSNRAQFSFVIEIMNTKII